MDSTKVWESEPDHDSSQQGINRLFGKMKSFVISSTSDSVQTGTRLCTGDSALAILSESALFAWHHEIVQQTSWGFRCTDGHGHKNVHSCKLSSKSSLMLLCSCSRPIPICSQTSDIRTWAARDVHRQYMLTTRWLRQWNLNGNNTIRAGSRKGRCKQGGGAGMDSSGLQATTTLMATHSDRGSNDLSGCGCCSMI